MEEILLKNYYEILEIAKNASPEIIDKAHKILVKKYHPDLQNTPEDKLKSEAKIKEINEAYDVLSNNEKRAEYDAMLANQEAMEKEKNIQEQIKQELHQQDIQKQNPYNQANVKSNNANLQQQQQFQKDYENAINKAYYDAYIQDMKNRGYKIKYKKTWNERIRSLIALLITIGIIMLILQLPFVKNYFNSLYRDNEIIRNIVDGFSH